MRVERMAWASTSVWTRRNFRPLSCIASMCVSRVAREGVRRAQLTGARMFTTMLPIAKTMEYED
jgi:hypothetical protein